MDAVGPAHCQRLVAAAQRMELLYCRHHPLADSIPCIVPVQAVPLVRVPPPALGHLCAHEHERDAGRTHIGAVPQAGGGDSTWVAASAAELVDGVAVLAADELVVRVVAAALLAAALCVCGRGWGKGGGEGTEWSTRGGAKGKAEAACQVTGAPAVYSRRLKLAC